jgi:glycyl-tRNA synthetase|eukprot:TRINITY_DN1303_c0_g1_i4.p1 TRINITY_DN1303_c0_g1~~TRINITY_DN1303_c0_g1_i4.p1  ORF type:complete len:699 (-),score=414.08 TRINITY_DN1303_c0_g1_i4:517-2613(-)
MSTADATPEQKQAIADLERDIGIQGNKVRQLKADKADKAVIKDAVAELNALKAQLTAAMDAVAGPAFERELLEKLLVERMFVVPSFEIYGGVAGFYDLGPPGCSVRANLINAWRNHFVLHDGILEIDCPTMMPEEVLRTSGHVERFTDLMSRDEVTGDLYRADHLVADHLEKLLADKKNPPSPEVRERAEKDLGMIDNYNTAELLNEKLIEWSVTSPMGNPITPSANFNLMFDTQIGPTGKQTGYLRPETAQGIFINFRRLYDLAGSTLPFGAAQIGRAFRNEISPKQGLLRVREFDMAEIEWFVNPEEKEFERFAEVRDVELRLLSADSQLSTRTTVTITAGEALEKGMFKNSTLAYFCARTQQFLELCGLDKERLRFRQHMPNELAHYSCDCWDAEANTSYGWVEIVGHADRSAYDLTVHSKETKVPLVARETYPEPLMIERLVFTADKRALGKALRKDAGAVTEHLVSRSEEEAVALNAKLQAGESIEVVVEGKTHTIEPGMVSWERKVVRETVRTFTPHVIEPSFGLGRILYCLLEHAFYVREDTAGTAAVADKDNAKKRTVLRLSPAVAPTKVALLPLSVDTEMRAICSDLRTKMIRAGVSTNVVFSGVSIGRKYARMDELGVCFAITVDFESKTDNCATLRERDSMLQVRAPIAELPALISALAEGRETWDDVYKRFPHQQPPSEAAEADTA